MQKTLIVVSAIFLFAAGLKAQVPSDTLRLTLPVAERIFIDSNLQLLAQKYNIDAQKALVMQARLWPNPNLAIERGPLIPIYDAGSQYPHSNFFLNSENSASLSQLILLAGKRNKQLKLAQANATVAYYQFFDLLRTLKYTLRTDFYNIFYLQRSAAVYDAEIHALQQIVEAFRQQQGKGYISEKEVVRIKAQLYSFQTEYNDLINQINDLQSEIRMILQVKPTVYLDPVVDSAGIDSLDPSKFPLHALVDSAYMNRTDLQMARASMNVNRRNYDYQKALAVPDLTASFSYDRQGSYATNFNAVGLSMDLPFFNRNQGNIKSARLMIANTDALEKSASALVEENVTRALQKAFAQEKLYRSLDPKFSDDFARLMHEVLVNYEKRNITLLDFLDFYDSYKQNILQLNGVRFNRVSAFEDINYYTATHFFN